MKRNRAVMLATVLTFIVCLSVLILTFCPSKYSCKADTRQFFPESSIIVDTPEVTLPIPLTIVLAARSALPPCIRARRFLGYKPVYYVRTNGYTCAVWNCPTEMWDSELGGMSDEIRVWVKDDTAKVVPTPSFSPRGNPNAKPPRLTADKALALAEMKTGFRFWSTNQVEDVGDFFKIGFTDWHSPNPILYAWVSKSDWSVCGNPFSHVPALTDQETYSAIANIAETRQSYDMEQPLGVYHVADMTIVTLPIKPLLRGSTTCIWIDNATKRAVFCFEY